MRLRNHSVGALRGLWLLLAVACGALTATVWGQEVDPATYPYVAYVAAERAPIHAGPGRAYYSTDAVARGMKVEVFREISGWLAIRPPSGSFCWISARDAELTDEPDVAMVLHDDTVAWIGTRTERDAEPVWQTQLARGDRVRILDVKRRLSTGGKPAETWYRIEPPEGEFRFIEAQYVARDLPALASDAAPGEAEVADNSSEPTASDEPPTTPKPGRLAPQIAKLLEALPQQRHPDDDDPAAHMDNADASHEEDAESSADEGEVRPAQFVPRGGADARSASSARGDEKSSPFREVGRSGAGAEAPRVASLDRSFPRDPAQLLSASSRFEDRLMDLELELSLMASRDMGQWQLDKLRAQAESLIASGQTTLERGRARLVLDKIAQFEALSDRRMDLPAAAPRAAGVEPILEDALPTALSTSASSPAPGLTIPDGVTYDGVGWLKPVYSARRIAPPFALVDADGKVVQYVTPAPGLNLNRFVKKPVGLYGQKSYLDEFKADHLTASRVVDLTKHQK